MFTQQYLKRLRYHWKAIMDNMRLRDGFCHKTVWCRNESGVPDRFSRRLDIRIREHWTIKEHEWIHWAPVNQGRMRNPVPFGCVTRHTFGVNQWLYSSTVRHFKSNMIEMRFFFFYGFVLLKYPRQVVRNIIMRGWINCSLCHHLISIDVTRKKSTHSHCALLLWNEINWDFSKILDV